MFDFFKALNQHAIFRVAVPVLTFISGMLLFRADLDHHFRKLVGKKSRTVLLPFLVFNLPFVVLVWLTQRFDLLPHQFGMTLYPFELTTWVNATLSVFGAPVNYPLSFLRDLFLLSLAAPLFGFLIRHAPWPGLVLVFLIFWFNLDGDLILRNTMPIMFYAGGMAVLLRWDLKGLDRYALPLLLLFLTLCAAVIVFEIDNRDYLRLISPLLIWPAASLLVGTRLGHWLAGVSPMSFFLFLAHAPLLVVFWILWRQLAGDMPYWLFWFGCPVAVAVVLALAQHVLTGRWPRLMSVLLGGRAPRPGRSQSQPPGVLP